MSQARRGSGGLIDSREQWRPAGAWRRAHRFWWVAKKARFHHMAGSWPYDQYTRYAKWCIQQCRPGCRLQLREQRWVAQVRCRQLRVRKLIQHVITSISRDRPLIKEWKSYACLVSSMIWAALISGNSLRVSGKVTSNLWMYTYIDVLLLLYIVQSQIVQEGTCKQAV